MSDNTDNQYDDESFEADSKADTLAIAALITIAFGCMVYLVY